MQLHGCILQTKSVQNAQNSQMYILEYTVFPVGSFEGFDAEREGASYAVCLRCKVVCQFLLVNLEHASKYIEAQVHTGSQWKTR